MPSRKYTSADGPYLLVKFSLILSSFATWSPQGKDDLYLHLLGKYWVSRGMVSNVELRWGNWWSGLLGLSSQLQQANENDRAHAFLCVSSVSPCCLGLDGKTFPNYSSRLCLPPIKHTVSASPYNEPVSVFCVAKVSGADTNGPPLGKCYACTQETNFFFGCIVFCQELYILQPGDN